MTFENQHTLNTAEANGRQAEEAAKQNREAALAPLRLQLEQWALDRNVSASSFSKAAFDELQSKPLLGLFTSIHGAGPSPTALKRVFKLNAPTYATLRAFRQEQAAQQKDAAEALKLWEAQLIHSSEMPERLGITRTELVRWREAGRLPIAKTKTFRKWGQQNIALYHHPDQLGHVTPAQIEQWREADAAAMSPQALAAQKRRRAKEEHAQQLATAIRHVETALRCQHVPGITSPIEWRKQVTLTLRVPALVGPADNSAPPHPQLSAQAPLTSETVEGCGGAPGTENEHWSALVEISAYVPPPKTQADLPTLEPRVAEQLSPAVQNQIRDRLETAISYLLATYESTATAAERGELRDAMRDRLTAGYRAGQLADPKATLAMLRNVIFDVLKRIDQRRAQELLELRNYPQTFPLARTLERHVHLKLGPTNSGKTYEALQALGAAKSGVYLAPLRLLAMEIRDQLTAQGIPCNLLTGEDHDLVEGAQHTACTIEMMDPTHAVEVAVIDEIQMLADPSRGWAWTAALVGVPAKTVFACGALAAKPACTQVLALLNETVEVAELTRKTPLLVQSEPVPVRAPKGNKKNNGGDISSQQIVAAASDSGAGESPTSPPFKLAPGDAVIAFSRKDVLTLSARIRQIGFRVATIYGALAPEVRRREADRFASGEAQIVVATDAIGMGLNLPIRRVVFSTAHKFDGISTRLLNGSEVQQIAGRAGRFGRYPEGYVAASDHKDLQHVRRMLEAPIAAPPRTLAIAPSLGHLQALAQVLKTQKIGALLTFFATQLHSSSAVFQPANLEDNIALGHVIDNLAPNLSLSDKFTFSCAPVAQRKPEAQDYFQSCVRSFLAERAQNAPAPSRYLQGLVETHGLQFLEAAERLSQDLTLYAWLSFKYPHIFHEVAAIPELRRTLSARIERALLHQSGFGSTSKESFYERMRYW